MMHPEDTPSGAVPHHHQAFDALGTFRSSARRVSASLRTSSSSSLNTLHTNTTMSQSLFASTDGLPDAVADWTAEDVGDWLHNVGLHEVADVFVHERIRGVNLPDLTAEEVVELGITRMGDRKFFFKALEHILRMDEQHHSHHVPMNKTVASHAAAPHLTRRTTVASLEPIPMKRRPSVTSFDSMSMQRRSTLATINVEQDNSHDSDHVAALAQLHEQAAKMEAEAASKARKTAELEAKAKKAAELEEASRRLAAAQKLREETEEMHEVIIKRKSSRPSSAQPFPTKRRMSGPPVIPSAENSVTDMPKRSRRTPPNVIHIPQEEPPELIDSPPHEDVPLSPRPIVPLTPIPQTPTDVLGMNPNAAKKYAPLPSDVETAEDVSGAGNALPIGELVDNNDTIPEKAVSK